VHEDQGDVVKVNRNRPKARPGFPIATYDLTATSVASPFSGTIILANDRTLVSEQDRRHHSSMNARAAAASARTTLAPFQKGQLWRIGDLNLKVTSVGKNLVHHKRFRIQSRGIETTLTSKANLRKYLLGGSAVLVAE
jgi:hypothetical protein